MIVKDQGNRKRRKLARKAKDLKSKMARKMLKYLEDNEDVKAGLCELKYQLETPEEAGITIMQIAKQARNERGQKLFQIFRQEENEVYNASLARWDTLKGLVELERRCRELMQEVKAVKRKTRTSGWPVAREE